MFRPAVTGQEHRSCFCGLYAIAKSVKGHGECLTSRFEIQDLASYSLENTPFGETTVTSCQTITKAKELHLIHLEEHLIFSDLLAPSLREGMAD
jgi:hypothetical protein